MAELSKMDRDLLNKIYYEDGIIVGRDKLYAYVREKYPERNITRRSMLAWIKSQEISQLHAKHKDPKEIKSTILRHPGVQVGIDLVDMQLFERDGYKYLFNGVDLFSRKLYSIPLKDKEAPTVLAGLKKMIAQFKDPVKSLRSDRGSEFIADIVKEYLRSKSISQVFSSAHKPTSNGGIERANQTLKRLIHKNIEVNDQFNWVKSIQKMVDIVNETIIPSKGASADKIESSDSFFQHEIYEKDVAQKAASKREPPHPANSYVRIYDPSHKMKSRVWSKELYQIDKVIRPRTSYGIFEYTLKSNELGVKKKFKHEDLQVVDKVSNVLEEEAQFEVSKILDKQKIGNEYYYLIKWKGYNKKSDNTWESAIKIKEDVPKMVTAFEKTLSTK
jgi:hypothetical protein